MTDRIDDSHLVDLFESLATEIARFDYSKELGELLPAEHEVMFSGEHDSNGHSRAPVGASTNRRKSHNRIPFDSVVLEGSLVSVGGPGNISKSPPRGLLFGTNVDYATFHQTGTSNMPARPPLGLSDETIDMLVNRVADATVAKLKH